MATHKSNLWAHQIEAIERISGAGSFFLMLPPGSGKTRTILEVLDSLAVADAFVFCPQILCQEWRDQMQIGGYGSLHDRAIVLKGEIKKRTQILLSARPGSIFITNYEAMTNKEFVDAVMKRKVAHLILDESQRLKNWRAERTKAAIKISKGVPGLKILLTGTPMPNDLRDLWSQWQILGVRNIITDNIYAFTARYMMDKNFKRQGRPGYFPDYAPRPGAVDEIMRSIRPWTMSRTKEEVLPNLPPLIEKTIHLDMLPNQARHYRELKKDFLTTIENSDKTCVVKNAGVKALRLMQLTSGILETVSGTEQVETPKDKALEELLEMLLPSMKVIIWTTWRGSYERIRTISEKMGKAALLVGGMSATDQNDGIQAFKADDRTRILIANPACAGLGLNLQVAGAAIYYSKSFNAEHYEQSCARNLRAGSEGYHQSILRYHLECSSSIDEEIVLALTEKISLQDYIMRFKYGNSGISNDSAVDVRAA